jgi:hypothetical protein
VAILLNRAVFRDGFLKDEKMDAVSDCHLMFQNM